MDSQRAAALNAAVAVHAAFGLRLHRGVDRDITARQAELAIRRTADVFAAWLAGTSRIRLVPGPVVNEWTGEPVDHIQGAIMQMNTGQKCSIVCDTEDAAGYDTVETIEWSLDNPDVATLQVSEDTRTCTVVSGAPGSAVLTASIPALGLSATLAVDVVPAGTATIELVPGEVVSE
ncbi:hypothetical protein [Nonomuraea typhae]|uniref:hypothetical protein n=1 Tax=Nonomuraea typhae TaxID=2603600 RepID=UPI0012FCB95E|nr:hypothetical protein [Nonomuraea typhae]